MWFTEERIDENGNNILDAQYCVGRQCGMGENTRNSQEFLSGVLQSVGGSIVLGIVGAIWEKLKHGSVDWLAIGGLFIAACVVFFVLFYFFRRSPAQHKEPSKPQSDLQPSRLKIIWAHFGAAEGPSRPVGEEYLQPRICGDSLVGWVGSDLFGPLDPAIGLAKRLTVRYSFDGEEATVVRQEHELLVLPEDRALKSQLADCIQEKGLNEKLLRAKTIEDGRELAIWRNEDIPCPHQLAQEEKLAAFRQEVFEEAAKALDTISIHAGGKYSEEAANYGVKVSASVIRRIAETYRDEFSKK